MELPTKNLKESKLFWLWLDDDGILNAKYKKNVVVNKDSLDETYLIIRGIIGSNKVCQLIDLSNRKDTSKEVRDYAVVENAKFMKAQALLVNSTLTKYIANLYISLKSVTYPIKLFTNETEAREWLKAYL